MRALLLIMLASPASASLVTRIIMAEPPAVSTETRRIDEHGQTLLRHAIEMTGIGQSLVRLYARIESVKTGKSIADEEPLEPAPYFSPDAEVAINSELLPVFNAAMARINYGSRSPEDIGPVLATYTMLGHKGKAKTFCKKMLSDSSRMEDGALLWLSARCRTINGGSSK